MRNFKCKYLEQLKSVGEPDLINSFPSADLSTPTATTFNWDQTGIKLVPVSSRTMAKSATKQIPVVGVEDKREITVLLAATAAGER